MTQNIFLTALIATSLFSCAPKDEKLVRPGGGNVRSDSVSNDDIAKTLLPSLDKQVEAVHYLKVLLDPNYAALQKDLKIEDLLVSPRLTIKKITGKLVNENDNEIQETTVDLFASISKIDNIIQSVEVSNQPFSKNQHDLYIKPRTNKSKTEVTSLVQTKKITFIKLENENAYSLLVQTDEEVNSKKNGKTFSVISGKAKFAWDGQDQNLTSAKLEIVSVDHSKYGAQNVSAQADGSAPFTVDTADGCLSLNGAVTLNIKGKNAAKMVLKVKDSSVAVENGAPLFSATDCKSRPVVDLRKLL